MEFGLNPGDVEGFNHKYKVDLEDDERDALAAAYREHLYSLALHKETESIDDFTVKVAAWDDSRGRSVYFDSPNNIIGVLKNFVDNTESAIVALPGETHTAPFMNDEIAMRLQLGKTATEIIEALKTGFNLATDSLRDIEGLPVVVEREPSA